MRHLRQEMRERRWTVAAVLAGIAYAVGVSFTRPFTLPADVLTAIALVAAVPAVVWRIRTDGRTTDGAAGWPSPWGRRWVAWVALTAVAGIWELYCYVSAPRVEHPTFSVLLDSADATRPGKAVVCALWLAFGWFLVAR